MTKFESDNKNSKDINTKVMFLIQTDLFLKILKRFPLIVFIIYSANTFAFATIESEDNIEEIEYLHTTYSASIKTQKLSSANVKAENTIWLTPVSCGSIKTGFILTDSNKLYILFCQLLLDQKHMKRAADNKSLEKININIQNIKYHEQRIKKNDRQSCFNCNNLLYSNHYSCNHRL